MFRYWKKTRLSKRKIMAESKKEKLIKEGCITVITGPCAIESWEQIDSIAAVVKDCGLKFIRRRSQAKDVPYSFQGRERGPEMIKISENMI